MPGQGGVNGLTFSKPTMLALPMGLSVPSIDSKVIWRCSADRVYLESKQCGPTKIWM